VFTYVNKYARDSWRHTSSFYRLPVSRFCGRMEPQHIQVLNVFDGRPGRRQTVVAVAVVVETIGCGGTPSQVSRGGDSARSGVALVRGFNDNVVRAAACCPVWPARCRASTVCAPAMSMQCGNAYTHYVRKRYRQRDQKYQTEGVRVSFGDAPVASCTGCFVVDRHSLRFAIVA